MASRDWDKLRRQDRTRKPLSVGARKALRLARLLEWRRKNPQSRRWALPSN